MEELRAWVGARRVRAQLLASAPTARIDESVHIRSAARLRLGDRCFIDAGVVLHCGGTGWGPDEGGISVGIDAYIGPNSVLFGAAGIEIGDAALISPGVVITSHQHSFRRTDVAIRKQPLQTGRVVIERDVWIGANATLLPGVRIGAGSIVGAGAVVTSDVPPGVVVVGVPARVLHDR